MGGYLCPPNRTISLATKTINIKISNRGVVDVATVVGNKVTNAESENNNTVENNSRSPERAPLTSWTQSCELSPQRERSHKSALNAFLRNGVDLCERLQDKVPITSSSHSTSAEVHVGVAPLRV